MKQTKLVISNYQTECVVFLMSFFPCSIAILALGGVVGPALGFILGGYLLSIYTDFITVDVDNEWVLYKDPGHGYSILCSQKMENQPLGPSQ